MDSPELPCNTCLGEAHLCGCRRHFVVRDWVTDFTSHWGVQFVNLNSLSRSAHPRPFTYGLETIPPLVFHLLHSVQFSSVQSLNHVQLFATPWMVACQASLSITNSWCLLKLMPIELVMPSSHLILCCPLLLLPPIPPSIRVFFNGSTLHMRWPKYRCISFMQFPKLPCLLQKPSDLFGIYYPNK